MLFYIDLSPIVLYYHCGMFYPCTICVLQDVVTVFWAFGYWFVDVCVCVCVPVWAWLVTGGVVVCVCVTATWGNDNLSLFYFYYVMLLLIMGSALHLLMKPEANDET